MTAIRTYRIPINRAMETRRCVSVGNWLHWTPFNGRPRLIVVIGKRKYVLSDQINFADSYARDGKRFCRLATGFQFHIGRLRFTTLAAR